MFFDHIASLTINGTIISNLGEFTTFKIVFATVFELREMEENIGIFSNEGCSKKLVLTMMRLTTIIPTPMSFSSYFRHSKNPNIVNFDAQYEAIPGKPKLAATDAWFPR